jgi:hypothetical protein
MADGFAAATANSFLGVLRGTTFTGYGAVYVQLHVGSPGGAGTSNPSAVTTRNAVTWNAPSAGSMTLNTLGTYSMTATETITDISIWSASSGGTFIESWTLTTGVPVINGSVISFSSLTLSQSPLAA